VNERSEFTANRIRDRCLEFDMAVEQAIRLAEQNRGRFLEELKDLVRIPSISAQPAHRDDVRAAATWIRDWIVAEGGLSEVLETNGHPIVSGELTVSEGGAVVLVYGHYDVQPVDPVELWDSDPFDPTVRGERLHARGASDMKSQLMATLFAIRSLQRTTGLPVNVRFLFEGEEEIGSPSAAAALEKYGDRFAADVCLNPDAGMLDVNTPSIRYGLRGLAYYELHLTGPGRDLHSGQFGGVVHNPAQALAEVIAGMHDADGRVTLPGFYDRVREIDADEKSRLGSVPFDETELLSRAGAPKLWGEPGFSAAERIAARPTLEVNGMVSGYTDPGAKTVIASKAMAKLSMRLVPDQRPEEVTGQLKQYLEQSIPATISWDLVELARARPYLCDPTSPAHVAAIAALESVWKTPPVMSRSGGTVPVTAELQDRLGIPSVLTGFALPDDNVHSPNESLHLPTWYRGIEAVIRFFENYGNQPTSGTV